MISRSKNGHPFAAVNLVLTLAQLKALSVDDNVNGEILYLNDGRYFYYNATSSLAGDDVFVVAPTTGSGRYLLAPGYEQNIAMAITFNTADAAVLATTPTNSLIRVGRGYWEVGTGWTGGSSSAIGISTNASGFNTKGDLLGGASGDVAATLVTGNQLGTIGAKTAAGVLIGGGVGIRFDRITSAFTAGTANAHLLVTVLANPGA